MIIGNHSAGKSSFLNWYIGETIQHTGVAIETRGFSFLTSGRKRETLKGDATLAYFDHLREIVRSLSAPPTRVPPPPPLVRAPRLARQRTHTAPAIDFLTAGFGPPGPSLAPIHVNSRTPLRRGGHALCPQHRTFVGPRRASLASSSFHPFGTRSISCCGRVALAYRRMAGPHRLRHSLLRPMCVFVRHQGRHTVSTFFWPSCVQKGGRGVDKR